MTSLNIPWKQILLLVNILFVQMAGCGRSIGPKRYDISGKVIHDGKLVPFGKIYFDPDVSKGNTGVQGVAVIKQGIYDTSRDGNGPILGPQIVRVLAYDGIPDGSMYPNGKPVFAPYTTQIEITEDSTTFDINVKVPPP